MSTSTSTKHVLVTWASERGGTEGIARTLGADLEARGFEVTLAPAARARHLEPYDAVVVGGAVYAARWHRDARRFVRRHLAALRRVPLWLFSSGPLDTSADGDAFPATRDVATLAERTGAQRHVTFGGRLLPDASGFPAKAMARRSSGDWRNPEHIHRFADEIARALPEARPRPGHEPAARSWPRLLAHGLAGALVVAALWLGLAHVAGPGLTRVLHAILAPMVFGTLATRYFAARGAREPAPVALAFTALLALVELAVAWPAAGAWPAWPLAFLATWATGAVVAMLPERRERA